MVSSIEVPTLTDLNILKCPNHQRKIQYLLFLPKFPNGIFNCVVLLSTVNQH